MCSAPKPKLPQATAPRALARMPLRIDARSRVQSQGKGATRPSLRNPDALIKRAPTAALGGSASGGVVLGG